MLWKLSQVASVLLLSVAGSLLTFQDDLAEQDEANWASKDPANVLGYESCRKCHLQQIETLTTTAHFKSFDSLHRSAESKAYCKQLGLRSIKRSERCVRCHYTPEQTSRGLKAQSGISCESCHGPAQNWIRGHNDYGGLTKTRETETAEHRAWRVKNSIEQGMRHPSNVYLLAKSCYDCHLVDDSELVNKTAHSGMTQDFNLVAWSQGSMRHNYLRSDGKENARSTPERLRVMFVSDLLARVEATLRAMSNSDATGRHYGILKTDLEKSIGLLQTVNTKSQNAWVDGALKALASLPPEPNPVFQKKLASYMSELAFDFAKNETVHQLEAIQEMLPSPSTYR